MNIISKIFTEKSIIESLDFKIVKDKYPVCKNHILAFSSERNKSALQEDSKNLIDLFENVKTYFGESFYFYERGNASFCTSLDGPVCSHIHFFPKKHFKPNLLDDLAQSFSIEKLKSFSDKRNILSEYFMIGDENEINFIELKTIPPKRFLRNHFDKHLA